MADEDEHEEHEGHEIPVVEPTPSPIHYHDEGAEFETDLVQEWLDKAKEEGVLGEDEHVTTANIQAVVKCAHRNELIRDLSKTEALVLFAWWWAFSAGFSFCEYRQRAITAQAITGMGRHMMEALGLDQEQEDDENPEASG